MAEQKTIDRLKQSIEPTEKTSRLAAQERRLKGVKQIEGKWFVISNSFSDTEKLAGPFDTREEADEELKKMILANMEPKLFSGDEAEEIPSEARQKALDAIEGLESSLSDKMDDIREMLKDFTDRGIDAETFVSDEIREILNDFLAELPQ